MSHIFISYSHLDRDYAHKLARGMEKHGFKVWVDDRIDYGSTWPQVIQDNLDSSSAVVVLMTPRAYKSEWVQSELSRAKRKQKVIFPLLLEGTEPWLSVESTQYVDVRSQRLPPEDFYLRLAQVVPLGAAGSSAPTSLRTTDNLEWKTKQILKALQDVTKKQETWEIGLFEVHLTIVKSGSLYLYAEVKDLERLKLYAPEVFQKYDRYLTDDRIRSERRRQALAHKPDPNDFEAQYSYMMRFFEPSNNFMGEIQYLQELCVKFVWYPSSDMKELPSIAEKLLQANQNLSLPVDLISTRLVGKTPPF